MNAYLEQVAKMERGEPLEIGEPIGQTRVPCSASSTPRCFHESWPSAGPRKESTPLDDTQLLRQLFDQFRSIFLLGKVNGTQAGSTQKRPLPLLIIRMLKGPCGQ